MKFLKKGFILVCQTQKDDTQEKGASLQIFFEAFFSGWTDIHTSVRVKILLHKKMNKELGFSLHSLSC